ncbi:MAG: hypothetical protein SPG52_02925, partial [Candidatus Cryptobacteroides sp.]|nr:hypothetical protein [Candidatus Cryptobacteroides sp.]
KGRFSGQREQKRRFVRKKGDFPDKVSKSRDSSVKRAFSRTKLAKSEIRPEKGRFPGQSWKNRRFVREKRDFPDKVSKTGDSSGKSSESRTK